MDSPNANPKFQSKFDAGCLPPAFAFYSLVIDTAQVSQRIWRIVTNRRWNSQSKRRPRRKSHRCLRARARKAFAPFEYLYTKAYLLACKVRPRSNDISRTRASIVLCDKIVKRRFATVVKICCSKEILGSLNSVRS